MPTHPCKKQTTGQIYKLRLCFLGMVDNNGLLAISGTVMYGLPMVYCAKVLYTRSWIQDFCTVHHIPEKPIYDPGCC